MYHGSVPLQIEEPPKRRRAAALICIEPPGNVARDLALYRRRLFAELGEGSALAFPEIAALAFGSIAARPRGRLASLALSSLWEGIGGDFGGLKPILSRGMLYLALQGPLGELSSRASGCLGELGFGPLREAPLEPGIGVFLCRPDDPELALAAALELKPPLASFRDCSLQLLGLLWGDDPFAACTWKELARSPRRTGLQDREDSTTTRSRPHSLALRSARSAASTKSEGPTKSG